MLFSACTWGCFLEVSPSVDVISFRSVPQGHQGLPILGTRILKASGVNSLWLKLFLLSRMRQHNVIKRGMNPKSQDSQNASLVITNWVGKVLNVISFKALFVFIVRSAVSILESCKYKWIWIIVVLWWMIAIYNLPSLNFKVLMKKMLFLKSYFKDTQLYLVW